MIVSTVWDGEEIKNRAGKLVNKSSFEIGLIVEGYAKELAPVSTGALLGSIMTASGMGQKTSSTDSRPIKKPNKLNETFVGTSLEYAPYQEYGTFKMNAQPFLRPALDMAKGKAPAIVQVGAKKEFGEYLNPK